MAETVEESFETEVRRKVTRTAFKIEEVRKRTSTPICFTVYLFANGSTSRRINN